MRYSFSDFLLASGIIDEITHKDMIPLQYQAQQLIRSGKYQDAIDFINIHIYCLISQAGYDVYEDTRIMRKHQYENLRHIFQSEQFKRMICIDEITFETKSDMLIEEIMPSVDNLMPKLLSHYKVITAIFFNDFLNFLETTNTFEINLNSYFFSGFILQRSIRFNGSLHAHFEITIGIRMGIDKPILYDRDDPMVSFSKRNLVPDGLLQKL